MRSIDTIGVLMMAGIPEEGRNFGCATLPIQSRAEQTMAMPAIRRRWTAADVRDLIVEDRPWPRYELIDDELLVTPAPRNRHQIAITELWREIDRYIETTPVGLVLVSPSDLELKEGTVVQPDVFVIPGDAPFAGMPWEWSDVKSLLLSVEILSPSSIRTDRTKKRDFYLTNGVEEYWIVDLDARVFERWFPSSETPEILRERILWAPRGQEPLAIDLPKWFAEVDRKFGMLPAWLR